MKTEGFFTADEISAAKRYGASIHSLSYNRVGLYFQTADAYRRWIDEQRRLHPSLWNMSMVVRKAVAS